MAFPHHGSTLIDTVELLSHNRYAVILPMARQIKSIGLVGLAIASLYMLALVNSFGF